MTDDTPTMFESPESSAVAGASYEPDTRMMLLYLRRQRDAIVTYRYGDVPGDVWEAFVQAPSKGQYFAQRIRPMFAGKAV